MPFHSKIQISNTITAYFWKNTEDLESLFEQVQLKETSLKRLEDMLSISHKKGFLGVRMLLQHLGYTDFDLEYDLSGKPHLRPTIKGQSSKVESQKIEVNEKPITLHPLPTTQQAVTNNLHISISHSHEFSCICISTNELIGIDLEKMKEKVLRIAPRFMNISHLEKLTTEEQLKKATIIWGVKESVFKVKNEVGISFPDHIHEDEFQLNDTICYSTLTYNNLNERFKSHFYPIEDFITVITHQIF